MLTDPWIYLAAIALCAVARELVRSCYRHRDMVYLLEKTQDPSSLHYLVQMEEARRPCPTAQRPCNDECLESLSHRINPSQPSYSSSPSKIGLIGSPGRVAFTRASLRDLTFRRIHFIKHTG